MSQPSHFSAYALQIAGISSLWLVDVTVGADILLATNICVWWGGLFEDMLLGRKRLTQYREKRLCGGLA